MPTLIEKLKKVEKNQQNANELKQAIIKFVKQPNIYNTLKQGALNGISAEINNGFTTLEAKKNDTDWERLGYLFSMETPHQIKPVLVAHIDLLNNGANVYIEHYESEQITKEHALQSLQSIIGLENK